MSDFAVGDVTMDTVYQAIQGLSAEQKAIANNIANIQTPNFTAQNVTFQTSLQQAINDGNPNEMQISVTPSSAAAQQNGNNVNLDDETVEATKNEQSYQTMIEAMNAKFQLLTDAIGSGSSS